MKTFPERIFHEDGGLVWPVRIRGWTAWFAQGAKGHLLGAFRSDAEAKAALIGDAARIAAAVLAQDEVTTIGRRPLHITPDHFPERAACIEDFDGDAMWCVWCVPLKSGAHIYFVGTPDGPLPDLYDDSRHARLAAIAAKAQHDRHAGT